MIGAVHLGRYISNVLLDVPNAFARTTGIAEERDVAGIALGIVGTYEREQRTLACTILSAERPTLSVAHCPVEFLQDGALAIDDAHLVHSHNLIAVVVVVLVG